MASTTYVTDVPLRQQLMERRERVEREIARVGHTPDLEALLAEVNHALVRADEGTLGVCETCREPIEADRVLANPLVRFCLDHLTTSEQRALERDLHLAARIQRGLLPAPSARLGAWDIGFEYAPAGVVSGDYCDYLQTRAGDLFFMAGDVSGKGIGASILMAHLRATLRTLIEMNLPLDEIMRRASSLFSESALPAQYATLVLGRATRDGVVDISNAGHPAPLLVRREQVERVDSTGLPLGMFRDAQFQVSRWNLSPGETLILYTDGVLDAEDGRGGVYGEERLFAIAARSPELDVPALVRTCVTDVIAFQGGMKRQDDITVAAVRRL